MQENVKLGESPTARSAIAKLTVRLYCHLVMVDSSAQTLGLTLLQELKKTLTRPIDSQPLHLQSLDVLPPTQCGPVLSHDDLHRSDNLLGYRGRH